MVNGTIDHYEIVNPNDQEYNKIFCILHGYGSNADNMINVSSQLYQDFPQSLFIAPNAPHICPEIPDGYQWSTHRDYTPASMAPQFDKSVNELYNFITKVAKKYKIDKNRLVLLGFSQGSMISMHYSLKFSTLGVLAYSGALIGGKNISSYFLNHNSEHHQESKLLNPKICIIHGTNDDVVPFECMQDAYENLKALNVDTVKKVGIKGLTHSMDHYGIEAGKKFLKEQGV